MRGSDQNMHLLDLKFLSSVHHCFLLLLAMEVLRQYQLSPDDLIINLRRYNFDEQLQS